MNSIALFARRSLLTNSARRAVSSRFLLPAVSLGNTNFSARPIMKSNYLSFSTERVPPEDYVDGHLLTDHLEYLDDMLDLTLKMEESMAELQDLYNEKQAALAELSDAVELDALFEKSASKKALMSSQIVELKAVLSNARAYASDAPDGTSDAEVRTNAKVVQEIIDDAAQIEDVDEVRMKHAMDRAVKKERARDTEHDW
mmetsp:Transcript_54612/g.132639  ORF Transcript_54612/g.132639 Transcript_54612/m.132639 type:complete len:200 (-) Transcript_54612:568-1167(-)